MIHVNNIVYTVCRSIIIITCLSNDRRQRGTINKSHDTADNGCNGKDGSLHNKTGITVL